MDDAKIQICCNMAVKFQLSMTATEIKFTETLC